MKHIRNLILALVLSAGLAPAFAQAPPPVPALPDTERRTSYVISGSTCACAVGFQLYQDSTDVANWLTVYINGVQIPQSGNWNITSPSGSISTLPRPITNAVLTFTAPQTGTVQIVGAQRPRRLSEYSENRGVAARDLNQAINGIEAQLREMWDRQFRTVQAPPGETLALLPVLSGRASMNACWDSSGNLTSCVGSSSGSFAAGNGINFTGTNPTTISTATYSAGTGINFTGSNPTVISVSPSTNIPMISTRTAAAALDLSAYTVIRTAGYATPGDGGGATFKNVGSAAFTDTYIATATRAGGSGYVNGPYVDVRLVGGTGKFCSLGATVSGNVVSAVSSVSPCNGYSVGDVLTAPNSILGGSGSGFSYTVTSIGGPGASFTDAAGTHWQYVPDGVANAKQFGCKGDWDGNDATATNNSPCLWSAIAFVGGISGSTISNAGYGGQLLIPKGGYMTCGAWNNTPYNFVVPQSVRVTGESIFGTVLKECDADPGNTYYIELCDPNVAGGQFGCKVEYMTLYAFTLPAASAGTAMIHSQSGQQFALAEEVEVDAGKRGCVKYEVGIGGASNDIWIGVNCVQINTATNPGFSFNAQTSQHIMQRSLCGSGPAGAAICIQNLSGRLIATDIDIEGYVTGLQQNVTVSGLLSSYKNVQEQAGSCTQAIQLVNGNIPNNLLIENVSTGCPITVQNSQPGGVNFTGNVMKQITCPGGACN